MEGPPRRVGSLSLAATRVDDVAQRLQTSAKAEVFEVLKAMAGPSELNALLRLEPLVNDICSQLSDSFKQAVNKRLIPEACKLLGVSRPVAASNAASTGTWSGTSLLGAGPLGLLGSHQQHENDILALGFSPGTDQGTAAALASGGLSGLGAGTGSSAPAAQPNESRFSFAMNADASQRGAQAQPQQPARASLSRTMGQLSLGTGAAATSPPAAGGSYAPLGSQQQQQVAGLLQGLSAADAGGGGGGMPQQLLGPGVAESLSAALLQARIHTLTRDNHVVLLKDFDEKVLSKMTLLVDKFGPGECLAMLDRIEEVLKGKAGRLANGPGYLDVSVSTRLDELKQRASGQVTAPEDYARSTLHSRIYAELRDLIGRHGFLQWHHFDQGIINMLKKMPNATALERLNELAYHSFKNVENPKSCIVSIFTTKPKYVNA
eukprot:XP_001694214.1 predicted protein [Chlamydomonas reinhardtii]